MQQITPPNWQHMTTQLDAGPNLMGYMTKLFGLFIAGNTIMILTGAAAVAAVTYGILNIFMEKSLITFKREKLSKRSGRAFRAALMVLIVTILPVAYGIYNLFTVKAFRITNVLFDFLICIIIAMVLGWAFSKSLKKYIPPTSDHILIGKSLRIVLDTLSHHITDWLAWLGISIINMIVKLIHIPFVLNYTVLAIVINLILSLMLIRIIGISKEMGTANMLGSLIGGVAHAVLQKNKLAELNAEYTKWAKTPKGGIKC